MSGNVSGGVLLPEEIGDFRLTAKKVGEEASEQTRGVHLGSLGNPVDGAIGAYLRRDGAVLHLWMSLYSSADEAERMAEGMARRMRELPELGYDPSLYTLEGVGVYAAVRGDAVHTFFARGDRVFYALSSGLSVEESLRYASYLLST